MRVLMLLALSSLSAASLHAKHLAARGHDNSYPSSGSPFTLEPAFTITLQLAAFPPAIQPPNFNGTVGLVPVTSGTVSGPLLNGTITQGLGVGHRSSTGFLDDDINYGHTDDGVEFLFRQTGGGQSSGSVERLVVTIGGKYAYLSESFLLQATETNATSAGGTLRGEVFVVGTAS